MAVLAVVGLVAAGAAYDRSGGAAGRAGLPLIGLTLSGNDVAHFERIYDRLSGDNREPRFYREHNRWRRAQLRYDGTVYTVQVKSHGRDPDGHSVERDGHRFISLSIKMAPGDRVSGLNRFKLIVGENLTETQQLVMTAAREAHVLLQDHRLVRVQLNDWPEQLFHFTNLLDDEYAVTAGQASLRTVTYDYPDDARTDKALVYTDSLHYRDNIFDFPEHFRRAVTQMGVPGTDWEPLLRRYSEFYTAISDGAADAADFFDLEYLGRYEAIRYVLGLNGHGFVLGNLRVFLNTANGKFYPALGRDNFPSTLDLNGSRTPEQQLNSYRGNDRPRALPMFNFVASSDRVRQAIYRAVYRFIVRDGARLVREIDQGLVAGGSLAPSGVAIVRPPVRASAGPGAATADAGVPVGRGESRVILTSNMQSLRRYLERSAPEYTAQRSGGRIVLEIRPDSMSELSVKRLTIGVRNGARRVDTPVRVQVTEGPGSAGDQRSASAAVDWLDDGRLDVSRVLAQARFATGLDTSIPSAPPAPPPLPPKINVRWADGLETERRRGLEARFGLGAGNEGESSTWSYALADASRENISALVRHPDVADTHNIDRTQMTLATDAFSAEGPAYQAPSLERVPRLHTLVLTVTGVAADDLRPEDIDLVFVNTVTGQEVEARRVASHDVGDALARDRPSALPPAPAVEVWLAAHPHLDIRQTTPGELRLSRGTYRIPEHLVLPREFNLSIESGAELQLGAGVVVLVRGGLHIGGTEDQPVTIRPIERGQSFGAVAVVGDGSQRTEVTYLELSGGSDAWLDGAHFAGALSIHYQDRVSVSHTTIRDNQGADGLSIKYAAGAVSDSSFTGNRDDQVDIEYFDGLLRDSRFESAPSGEPNGDGLDLPGLAPERIVELFSALSDASAGR